MPKFTGYQKQPETYKALYESALSLGKSMPKPKRRGRRKPVDLSQFRGMTGQQQPVQAPTTPYKSIPQGIRDLGTITTPYGGRTRYEGSHRGIDIASKFNTPVPAYMGGKVVENRKSPTWGNTVVVQDKLGNFNRYSHLSGSWVRVGEQVEPGMPIGGIGRSGSVYSQTPGGDPSHLDFRIYNLAKKYFSPLEYLDKYSKNK